MKVFLRPTSRHGSGRGFSVVPTVILAFSLILALAGGAHAKAWWLRGVESNDHDFLPPDEAFRVSSTVDGELIHVRWVIADGYYLYRGRMEVQAESPGLVIATPNFPQGTVKSDPYQGTQEIFTQQVEVIAKFARNDHGAHPLQIKVSYQGCAEAGLCYPPLSKVMFPTASPGGGDTIVTTGNTVKRLPHRWEFAAILFGGTAFLLAGMVLRKGRRLASPA